jgi:hypothetical protein
MLRAFYRIRDRLDPNLQQAVVDHYQECRGESDPFVSQSALHELLLLFQEQQTQVVLVLNRFDRFCEQSTPPMINTLRGMRDNFKDTLHYIVGMGQEVAYLSNPEALGDMYDILDSHVCWVGSMNQADARFMIGQATGTADPPPSEAEIAAMLALTGHFPALLKATCHWWLTKPHGLSRTEWHSSLFAERTIQHRLSQMWSGLTQEEQLVLSEVQKLQEQATHGQTKALADAWKQLTRQHHFVLERLATKRVCRLSGSTWQIKGELLFDYIASVEGRSRGKIWLDEHEQLQQGSTLLTELTELQRVVLTFLARHPYERHTKTDLIFNTWPDELRKQGVSDDALYQIIMEIRKQIEPNPSKPNYLVTWRGKPEGGYQFFPEGRPG